MPAQDPFAPSQRPRSARQFFILLAALVLARIAFIAFMPATYSIDLHSWLRVMDNLEHGGNPYRDMDVLNWPPFWMQILFGLHQVAKHTGASPVYLIQGTLILGEVMVLCTAFCMARRFFPKQPVFLPLLLGLALNPVSIFLSCQHCNYDVFVGLFVLLTAWMLMEWVINGKPEAWLAASFFLGMGILAKTVPIILTPLLLLHFRRLSLPIKAFGALLVAAPFIIGMSVLFTLEPYGVMRNVVDYRSYAGYYGITGLLLRFGWLGAHYAYANMGAYLFIGLMGYMAFWCYRQRIISVKAAMMLPLLLMMFIPTFGPGYSPPYILWFLPVMVLLPIAFPRLRIILLTGYVVLICTYVTEYALFRSHGAFLQQWYPSAALDALGSYWERREGQTLIRLPMFLFYLGLFVTVIKSIRTGQRAALSGIA